MSLKETEVKVVMADPDDDHCPLCDIVDDDGCIYFGADWKDIDGLKQAFADALEVHGLEVRDGNCGDDRHYIAVVKAT